MESGQCKTSPQYHCRRSVPRDAALTQQHGFQPGTKQHNQKATRRGYCSYCCYYWPLRDGSPSQSPPSCIAAKAVTAAAEDHAAKTSTKKFTPIGNMVGRPTRPMPLPRPSTRHEYAPDGQTNPFLHIVDGVATDYDHASPSVLSPRSTAGASCGGSSSNRELAAEIP